LDNIISHFVYVTFSLIEKLQQIFRISTVHYAEGLWRMRRHRPVIAHCTDLEDFPKLHSRAREFFRDSSILRLVYILSMYIDLK